MNVFKKSIQLLPYITRAQRRGIFSLVLVVVVLQLSYFIYMSFFLKKPREITREERLWMQEQVRLDSLQHSRFKSRTRKIYPFNPNFISDRKAYELGMSTAEIDRLHRFRAADQFVNSAGEFQKITQISDELLDELLPYFKFPQWVNQRQSKFKNAIYQPTSPLKPAVKLDLNRATAADLQAVRGIGPVYSKRIVQERERIGGFLDLRQLDFIWGLPPEAIVGLKDYCEITTRPAVEKLNINEASLDDLKQLPYLNYTLARNIVIYRSMHGPIANSSDLMLIKNFPLDKIDIISLYLNF